MRGHLQDMVVHKAQQDDAFRAALLVDPRAAIRAAFPHAEVPDDLAIEVLQENVSQAYIVLPAGRIESRLSEEQLEMVSGGGCVPCFAMREPPQLT